VAGVSSASSILGEGLGEFDMKELFSSLLEAVGKWLAKMMKANPRAFFAGLVSGTTLLLCVVWALIDATGAKPHVVWVDTRSAVASSQEQTPILPRRGETSSNADNGTMSERDPSHTKVLPRRTLKITSPSGGDIVSETIQVRGFTPYVGRNHYILVMPETSDEFLQDDALRVSPSGAFVGDATIGSATVGVNQKYLVRVLATKMVMPPGSVGVPADAVFSEAVTVYRK
jgi:hypothetical protein